MGSGSECSVDLAQPWAFTILGVILSGWKADTWSCHCPPSPRSSDTWALCTAGPEMTLSQQKGTHGVSIQDIQDNQEARN